MELEHSLVHLMPLEVRARITMLAVRDTEYSVAEGKAAAFMRVASGAAAPHMAGRGDWVIDPLHVVVGMDWLKQNEPDALVAALARRLQGQKP